MDTGMLCLAPISALLNSCGKLATLKGIMSFSPVVAFKIGTPWNLFAGHGAYWINGWCH